jgi:hypothetical protein
MGNANVLNAVFGTPRCISWVSEEIAEVVKACGYRREGEWGQYEVYIDRSSINPKRLILGARHIEYSIEDLFDEEPFERRWYITSTFDISYVLDPIAYLDILQAIGAINYHNTPGFKEVINELLNEIRKKHV